MYSLFILTLLLVQSLTSQTTAVGSLLVGQVVGRVRANVASDNTSQEVAHTLSLLCGVVLLFFGLFRLGWIIEFIPYIPISAFVTAASITIMSTQIPTCLGITGINNHAPPYRVLIDTFKALPRIQLDAAIGLSSIVLLFAIRGFCSRMEARQPAHKRIWTFVSSLRLTFTMLLFTLISFLVHGRGHIGPPKFRIVGPIERGTYYPLPAQTPRQMLTDSRLSGNRNPSAQHAAGSGHSPRAARRGHYSCY